MTKQVKRMKNFLNQEIKYGLKILYVNYGKKEIIFILINNLDQPRSYSVQIKDKMIKNKPNS